mgnify:CR=1 FL=1
MKDGRTHLALRAERAVDLDTGAIVAVTVQGADLGDTTTVQTTLPAAVEQLTRSMPITVGFVVRANSDYCGDAAHCSSVRTRICTKRSACVARTCADTPTF